MFKKCLRKKFKTEDKCRNACFRLGMRIGAQYSPVFCEVCHTYHIKRHV